MRTILFLLAGFLLLGGSAILSRLFAPAYPSAPTVATIAFVAVWLALTTLNLWTGVSRAGYSVAEEVPILLVLFGVPAAAALLLHWRPWA